MKRKYFITGGSGYIGRNVITALIAAGHEVVALARSQRSSDIVKKIGAIPAFGNLDDQEALIEGMKGCEYLIHAAADTSHGRMSETQRQANIDGTRRVYRAAKNAGIERALHLSTEAVLLSGQALHRVNETQPYPETFAGGYSESKAGAEKVALEASDDSLEIIVLRPRFVWGKDDTTALPQLIEAARSGKLAWIDGGQYLTSTTHVDNLVHALLLALDKGKSKSIYFVSDDEDIPFRDFITAMLETQDVPIPTKSIPRWLVSSAVKIGERVSKWTKNRVHGPMTWQEYATLGVEVTLDISKAKQELTYRPLISRAEGLLDLRERFLSGQ